MQPSSRKILVSIPSQQLTLLENGKELGSYPISTALHGPGSEDDSGKTPTGKFRVDSMIGDGLPEGTVFKSRKPTGEIYPPECDEDLVMSRILWLDGTEQHNSNTKKRYIYIHGTNHEDRIGAPVSHGCIRMKNRDVVELYDMVSEGIEVEIIC